MGPSLRHQYNCKKYVDSTEVDSQDTGSASPCHSLINKTICLAMIWNVTPGNKYRYDEKNSVDMFYFAFT